MKSVHRQMLIIINALFVFVSSYGQDGKNDLVTVKLDIVGKGSVSRCKDASTFYFANVTILNTQDTAVTFWIRDSWPDIVFFTNTDSIVFHSCGPGYDGDELDKITLPPKIAIQFYCTIKSWKKGSSIPLIKAGFRYFKTAEEVYFYETAKKNKEKIQTFWSNEVELKDNMYSYEVK